MKHTKLLTVLLAALLVLAILPVTAQEQTGVARVRIGYFAFDPRETDTYIDGELAAFDPGWEFARWPQQGDQYWHHTGTPYLDVPSGSHSFAFVEDGGSLEAAFLGPITVEFQPGHTYSLALVGQMERNNVDLLMVDETETFAGVDPAINYRGIVIHDTPGAPPIKVTVNGETVIENLPYGRIATYSIPGGFTDTIVTTVGDEPVELFEFDDSSEKLNCELMAMVGAYPGRPRSDIFWAYNFGYTDEPTLVDGGAITVGDTLEGVVSGLGHRVAYRLSLESDSSLNIYTRTIGFDSMVYVYDSSGSLMFWNDERSVMDGHDDAGLEAVSLKAGDYTIEVGGFGDLITGPYRLVVESAE